MLRPLDGLQVNALLHKLPPDEQQNSMGARVYGEQFTTEGLLEGRRQSTVVVVCHINATPTGWS